MSNIEKQKVVGDFALRIDDSLDSAYNYEDIDHNTYVFIKNFIRNLTDLELRKYEEKQP